MKKSNAKGFTLVELVVVIAIIGVLAAILVPSMMGYVKKSRLKTANANAKTVYNAVAEINADMETKGTPIDWTAFSGITDYDCKADTTPAGDALSEIQHASYTALAENGAEAGCVTVFGDQINGKDTFIVQWRKTTTDNMIGQYPDQVSSVDKAEAASVGTYIAP